MGYKRKIILIHEDIKNNMVKLSTSNNFVERNDICKDILYGCDLAYNTMPDNHLFRPNNWEQLVRLSYNYKTDTLINVKRYDEAVKTCERAIKEGHNTFYRVKVQSLLKLKRFNEAIAECDKGIDSFKDVRDIYERDIKELTNYKTEAQKSLESLESSKWFSLGYNLTLKNLTK